MVLPELRCSLLEMTMAQKQTGNPKRKGRKITTVAAENRQYFHGAKNKAKYAREIPEPIRNSNIILNNNLLLKETHIQEKKLPFFFFIILNRKTEQNHRLEPWR